MLIKSQFETGCNSRGYEADQLTKEVEVLSENDQYIQTNSHSRQISRSNNLTKNYIMSEEEQFIESKEYEGTEQDQTQSSFIESETQ